jgi:hypothetical protein
LHRNDFLDPSAVRPLQYQTEGQLDDLRIKGNVEPRAIPLGEPVEYSVEEAPGSTDEYMAGFGLLGDGRTDLAGWWAGPGVVWAEDVGEPAFDGHLD